MPKSKKNGKSVSELVPMPKNERLRAMQRVSDGMLAWRPAREILRKVEAIPTIFPQFDRGTRVGGMPIGIIATNSGPTAGGKTEFGLGIGKSFLQSGHFFAFIDAEMTTPITWIDKMMAEYADHPGFLAMRPKCFEDANEGVRKLLNNFGEAKSKGMLPEDTSLALVIDSPRKLVPRNLLANLLKEGTAKHGIDGMRGRGAQLRAALVAQWLDELVPLLHETRACAILVARETEDPDADANDRKYGRDFKITGGKAMLYDASLVSRIERSGWVYQGSEDERNVIGERHRIRIWKSKVAGRDDKVTDCFFHTSNGKLVPEGFDTARDLLELGCEMGMVEEKGAWLHWDGNKWNGRNKAVSEITADPGKLNALDLQVRSGFVIDGQDPVVEDVEQASVATEAPPPRRKKKVVESHG